MTKSQIDYRMAIVPVTADHKVQYKSRLSS